MSNPFDSFNMLEAKLTAGDVTRAFENPHNP